MCICMLLVHQDNDAKAKLVKYAYILLNTFPKISRNIESNYSIKGNLYFELSSRRFLMLSCVVFHNLFFA